MPSLVVFLDLQFINNTPQITRLLVSFWTRVHAMVEMLLGMSIKFIYFETEWKPYLNVHQFWF